MVRCLLVTICGLFLFLCPSISESQNDFSCETLTFFYRLWEDSAFGRNPDGVERAAWIIGDGNGYQMFQKWPNTGDRSKIFFEGPMPRNVLAVVHTHPAHKDSKPSTVDVSFGKRTRINVYVISEDGLWMSNMDGRISRVMGYVDFKEALNNCEAAPSKNAKPKSFLADLFLLE
jgi:hypothetical protein